MKSEKQRFFEQAVGGLLEQGEKSVLGEGDSAVFAYRGNNGNKCGIGMCITDEAYDKAFGRGIEGLDSNSIIALEALFDSGWTKELLPSRSKNSYFFNRIQFIHDAISVSSWPEAYSKLGLKEDLDISFIEEYEAKQ